MKFKELYNSIGLLKQAKVLGDVSIYIEAENIEWLEMEFVGEWTLVDAAEFFIAERDLPYSAKEILEAEIDLKLTHRDFYHSEEADNVFEYETAYVRGKGWIQEFVVIRLKLQHTGGENNHA